MGDGALYRSVSSSPRNRSGDCFIRSVPVAFSLGVNVSSLLSLVVCKVATFKYVTLAELRRGD